MHIYILAYYAWPRTYPPRSWGRNPWRQHVHRTTRRRSQAIDMAWRHVDFTKTRRRSQAIDMAWRRVDFTKKPTSRFKHVTSIICYLCFMQYAWRCTFFYFIFFLFWYFADRASQHIYLNINQLDALNFIKSLFHASTCFEHMCWSSGGQNCAIQPLISSHL